MDKNARASSRLKNKTRDQRFYEKLDSNPINDDQQQVKLAIAEMINNELPPSATNLVVTTPRASSFYLLPKIHKPGNPGRPIVSACSCLTGNIAVFLDKITAPLVCNLQTCVKDTKHALQIFDEFRFGDGNIPSSLWISSPSTRSSLTMMVSVPLHIFLTSER